MGRRALLGLVCEKKKKKVKKMSALNFLLFLHNCDLHVHVRGRAGNRNHESHALSRHNWVYLFGPRQGPRVPQQRPKAGRRVVGRHVLTADTPRWLGLLRLGLLRVRGKMVLHGFRQMRRVLVLEG